MDVDRIAALEKKLAETSDIAARGFQGVSRDLAHLQRDVSELRTLVEGWMNWIGRDAVFRNPASPANGEARLTMNLEVRPGSFVSGPHILRKEFDCDVTLKNVGTGPAEDFQLEAEFPAEYVDLAQSRQFFLRKRDATAVFRVRESNYPNERLLPGRDLRVMTVHYAISPESFQRLVGDPLTVHFVITAAQRTERVEVPFSELVTLTPHEEQLFLSRSAQLSSARGA